MSFDIQVDENKKTKLVQLLPKANNKKNPSGLCKKHELVFDAQRQKNMWYMFEF